MRLPAANHKGHKFNINRFNKRPASAKILKSEKMNIHSADEIVLMKQSGSLAAENKVQLPDTMEFHCWRSAGIGNGMV